MTVTSTNFWAACGGFNVSGLQSKDAVLCELIPLTRSLTARPVEKYRGGGGGEKANCPKQFICPKQQSVIWEGFTASWSFQLAKLNFSLQGWEERNVQTAYVDSVPSLYTTTPTTYCSQPLLIKSKKNRKHPSRPTSPPHRDFPTLFSWNGFKSDQKILIIRESAL